MRKKIIVTVFVLLNVLLSACGSQKDIVVDEVDNLVAKEESAEVGDVTEAVSEEEITEVVEEMPKFETCVKEYVDTGNRTDTGNTIVKTIKLNINYPEGYYLDDCFSSSTGHRLYSPLGYELQIMAASEEEKAAYDNYLLTGEWIGVNEWELESMIAETTVEVPIGTVTVITGQTENGRVTEHGFIDYEGVLWSICRKLYFYADTADTIESVLNQIFNERELKEVVPLINITSAEPEIADGEYEYNLVYNVYNADTKVSELKNIFGFNFSQNKDFNLLYVNSWGNDGELIDSYHFTGSVGNFDDFIVEMTSGNNIAFLKEYMTYGTYTENARINWDGGSELKEMELGEIVNTPYGEIQIFRSRWENGTSNVREIGLINVYGYEIMICYEHGILEEVDTLENYEGKLKNIIENMF